MRRDRRIGWEISEQSRIWARRAIDTIEEMEREYERAFEAGPWCYGVWRWIRAELS